VIGGDISNETPPRIVVTIDAVTEHELVEERKNLRKRTVLKVTSINNAYLSLLWNRSFQYGIAFELVAFEEELWTEKHITALISKLEDRGGNPFAAAVLLENRQELVGELPYRPNLKGVISPTPAVFGSWGIDIFNL
jgi:hypothetical protein